MIRKITKDFKSNFAYKQFKKVLLEKKGVRKEQNLTKFYIVF